MRQALLQAWTRRGWLAWLLWPVSLAYGALVLLRRGLYQFGVFQTHSVGVPVVIVGNVVAGGAGKTPAVIAIVEHLKARGLQPGVVSRGYGRATNDCREATPDSTAADVGDEPALIARSCSVPVFVAAARDEAVRKLLKAYPQTGVIVCDDGLQHYALQRDVEICVFDDRGIGNGFLLPAGPLREPWPRAVDIVLNSGPAPAVPGFGATRELADHAQRADGSRITLAGLSGQRAIAVAGIARPEPFFEMLRERGVILAEAIALPDHHDFSGWQPPAVPTEPDLPLLCTEKDAVKLWHTYPQAWAVPLVFTPDPGMLQALDGLVDARLGAKLSSAMTSHGNR